MAEKLRIAFMGTPDFAVSALNALHEAGHEIVAVYSQPPRPAGRGHKLQPSPVQRRAEELGLPVRHPKSLKKDDAARAEFAALNLDSAVVAAYGLILPKEVLDAPKFGCLNIHASLLPRWRGAAPIHRAIEAGDAETGVTIMQMEEGLDTGPMLTIGRLPIAPDDSTGSLHDKLAALGGEMIVDALRRLEQGGLSATPQPDEGVCYAAKIAKEEAALDLRQPAEVIGRKIRAFNPFPGAFATFGGTPVKFWRALPEQAGGPAGKVLAADADGIVIACGGGAIRVLELQKPGGKRLPAGEFLKGFPLAGGMFSLPESA
ncbi:MAG TPA: methionyl-tRNA formyltransferase [Patescibacteria group bacterium]|nr:methionyl-tRNA formyltransferase [Patescibacteria group bacterium]